MKGAVGELDMLISIVIPVHNEEQSLRQLVFEINEVINVVNYKIEVLIVNDASTDKSVLILDELKNEYVFLVVINMTERGGQTGCYQEAFREARGKYIIRMDGDLQDDPQDLFKFFSLIEKDVDMIMGLRHLRCHKKILKITSILYDALALFLFDSPLHTNTGSFVAIKAEYIKNVKFKKNDHRYLPLIAMRRGASVIKEEIVNHRSRLHGKSKYDSYMKVILGIQEVLRVFVRLKLGYYDIKKTNKGVKL